MSAIEIPENWTFRNQSVAAGFDQHVREQLPWYDLVTGAIVQLGRHYIGQGGRVYDIGAATGNITRALAPVCADRDAVINAIEESEEMAETWQGRGFGVSGNLHSLIVEPAQNVDYKPFDLAVSMLCLMFLRPGEVETLLGRLAQQCTTGGAVVVVERMLPPNGYLSVVSSRLTLAAKLAAGVTPAEIVTKELSLAGVQRPLDPRLLQRYGAVEWFRYGDFAGWIIEGGK